MATVEELRDSVLEVRTHLPTTLWYRFPKDLDSLISAAEERGAETNWRKGYNQGWDERKAFEYNTSALAKEADNGKQG